MPRQDNSSHQQHQSHFTTTRSGEQQQQRRRYGLLFKIALLAFAVGFVSTFASRLQTEEATSHILRTTTVQPTEEEEDQQRRQLLLFPRTVSYDSEDIAANLYFADENGATNIGWVPTEFSGLWWMDGNPLTMEFVLSMGQSNWKSVDGDGYRCRGGRFLKARHGAKYECLGGFVSRGGIEERTWSYSADIRGRMYMALLRFIDNRSHIECGGDKQAGTIRYCSLTAAHNVFGFPLDIIFWISGSKWEMIYAKDDLWYRDSTVPYSYRRDIPSFRYFLKRIVNGDGKPNEPYWSQFLSRGMARPIDAGDSRTRVSFVPRRQAAIVH